MIPGQPRRIRTGLLVLLLALTCLAPGCFGSFSLVRKVYDFNQGVSDEKWVREGIFLLLNIPFVPVYSVAAALDALFFNSIEFWTGDSLLAQGATRTVVGARGEVARATFRPDGRVELLIVEPSGERHEVVIERVGDLLVARAPDGPILARSRPR